jgi:L-ascorbate metabolism protein UlaG (beta-lactamase superfamily)
MIKAFQSGDNLRKDILAFSNPKKFKVWWLGQSGFLIKYQGKTLLFDPYLSDSLTNKYAETDKPHVRMSELCISPSRLDIIDVVTSSHNHTDHLDAETLNPLFEVNPKIQFVIPEANRALVCDRLGCEENFPLGLDIDEEIEVKGFKIIGLPAAHNEIDLDEKGRAKYMSFIVQFGDFIVYHSGDTLWYKGLEKRLLKYKPDVAFLPINGSKPERGVAGNLSANEAAQLGKESYAGCVIPHHYNMFEFNTEDPASFILACEKHETPHCVLKVGEGIVFGR